MTARDYPCPDCESWECGGLGCIGRVRMESAGALLPGSIYIEPPRACAECFSGLPVTSGKGRPLVTCSDECRAKRKRRCNARWMRENRPSRRKVSS